MTYNHFYGVKCQMCGDDPNITCTCEKNIAVLYVKSVVDLINESEREVDLETPIKPKKKRMTRMEKQAMYGGR